MVLIDLGEVRDTPEPEPGPRSTRRWRWRDRRWHAVLLAALVVVTVSGAVPPTPRVSVAVPAQAGAEAFVVDNGLVVVVEAVGVRGGRQVTAYDLPSGRGRGPSSPVTRWRTSVAGVGDLWPADPGGGILLLANNTYGPATAETIAVDAATGRTRWRQPGVLRLAAGGALLQTVEADGGGSVRLVDPSTGAVRWSAPAPPESVSYRSAERRVDRIVLALPSGQVEVRDANSGRVLSAARIRAGSADPGERIWAIDDVLVILAGDSVSAYDLNGLKRRWVATVPGVGYLTSCGALLCAWPRRGGVWTLDRSTGRAGWIDPRWRAAYAVGDRLLAGASRTPGDERLSVLDAATGRVLADLGRWDGIRTLRGSRPPLAWKSTPDGRLLVAELDVQAGRVWARDVVPEGSSGCWLDIPFLLCRRPDGSFRVSELRV